MFKTLIICIFMVTVSYSYADNEYKRLTSLNQYEEDRLTDTLVDIYRAKLPLNFDRQKCESYLIPLREDIDKYGRELKKLSLDVLIEVYNRSKKICYMLSGSSNIIPLSQTVLLGMYFIFTIFVNA